MSLIFIAIIQSLLFVRALSQGTCKETSRVKFTFYGMVDGGDTTSFSCGAKGNKAGGIGTYTNPETFATAQSNPDFTNCEIIYIPYFRKYFQYSDHCVKCDEDYSSTKALHIDLWIGSSTNGGPTQILCEDTFGSVADQTIIQNPPSTLPVNSNALWDGNACHDASSSDPLVFPNPSSSGLCAGGTSNQDGGAASGGGSSSASSLPPTSITPSSSAPTMTPSSTPSTAASILPPVYQPKKAAVEPPRSSSSPISTTPSITPTTLVTQMSSSSISTSSAVSTTSSNPILNAAGTADNASRNGRLGYPCQTYNDCAGDWICMGTPKTCHDNRLD